MKKEAGSTANTMGPTSAKPSPIPITHAVNPSPTIQFDISKLQNYYANVCSVSSTREEVVLAFGVNNGWERAQANQAIQLTSRIVLNPYAAKRLTGVLNRVLAEYESKFGSLKDDPKSQANAA